MKKLLKVLLVFVASVFVALLVAPLFYSIDEMRPKIEKSLSQQVQGEIKISSLSFSLFPSVNLGAAGVTLLPIDSSKPVATVEEVSLSLPLLSFFVSPKATLELDGLSFSWVKDENGNVDNLRDFLPKESQVATPGASPDSTASKGSDKSAAEGDATAPDAEVPPGLAAALESLPSWLRDLVLKAKFSFEVSNSEITLDWKLKDGAFVERLKDVNFGIENFGFNEAVRVYANAQVEMTAEDLKLTGPVEAEGEMVFQIQENDNLLVKLKMEKTLDDLSIQVGDLLNKKPGTALSASGRGEISVGESTSVKMSELGFRFGGIALSGMLDVNLPASTQESITLKTRIKSEEIDLSSLGVLLPMVRDYQLAGKSTLDFAAEGDMSRLKLDGKIAFNGVGGKTPALAKAIKGMRGDVLVGGTSVMPSIRLSKFFVQIGESDLGLSASVSGAGPSVSFDVESKMLNLDELMETYLANSAAPATEASAATSGGASASQKAAPATESLDASLASMAPMVDEALENEMLSTLKVDGKVTFEKVRLVGALYENARFDAQLANRDLALKTSEMRAYGGRMTASANLALKPRAFAYDMNAALGGIKLEEALAIHAPKWREDVQGSLEGSFALSGRGLSKKDLAKNLKGSLKGELKDGVLDIPVLKVLNDAVAKLPAQLKDSTMKKLDGQNFNGSFKTAQVETLIRGRELQLKKLDVLYDTQKGGLGDMRLNSTGTVDFDQNIDLVSTLFVTQKVINVGELKGKSGFVEVPLKMKGTLSDPKVDSAYTGKILGERMAKNAAKKAVEKVAPKVVDKIKEKVPEKHKKKVDDLLKKIGF